MILYLECSPVHLAFVLDVSGTISAGDFQKTQTFVKSVIGNIGVSGNKVGVVTYGDLANIDINCTQYSDLDSFNSDVDKLNRKNGLTNTRDGIEKGEEVLDACYKDPNVTRIIILVTDGMANDGVDGEDGLIQEAQAIQNRGTTLFIVAVGMFSRSQIDNMTVPSNIFTTMEEGFDGLNDAFVEGVRKEVCDEVTDEEPIPTTSPCPSQSTTPTSDREYIFYM